MSILKKLFLRRTGVNTLPKPKDLPGFDIPYCNYDYVEAWFKFMLFQTPNFDHLWFINFDKQFD
jgi:hypothetical protein